MDDVPIVMLMLLFMRRALRRALPWALAIILGFAGLVVAIWVLPTLLTNHPSVGPVAAARLKAENDVRTPLVAALAVIGAALITASYAVRTTRLTLQAQQIDRNRQELDLQGQLTDRYTKAVDQLASEMIEVRIGGIYALERLSKDSVRDQPTVMEILAAYIRQNSQERWPIPEADGDIPERTRPDMQAAITVIARRNVVHDRGWIDLTGANLPRAELNYANLAGVNLTGANLFRANLTGADLTNANIVDANLVEASLVNANLTEANLTNTNLRDVNLTNANLTDAIGASL